MQSFYDFLTNQLNPLQQTIVTPHEGILLVRAGAGSGKTRIITARIAHLMLNHCVAPQAILALTFTNKAAQEMKERVAHFLMHENVVLPFVGTFHAYCLRFLKQHGHHLNLTDFTILDEEDQHKLLRSVLQRAGAHKKLSPQNLAHTISLLKNEAITGTLHYQEIADSFLRDLIYTYEQEKTVTHCLDFDDLLLYTIRILHKQPSVRIQLHSTINHILVDEYQDTNHVQHALLKLLTLKEEKQCAVHSLCIVGDEDQSIYSWRGATVSNMVNFAHEFPQTQPFVIEQNYRSVQPILETANKLIQHNSFRNAKNLWSAKKAHDRIRILSCSSPLQEAEAIAVGVAQKKSTTDFKNIALLYRSHYQSRALEEALIRHKIPYKIIGGIQFYERQEIKDILAYLRLVVNPFNHFAFTRIINVPTRGLGDKFVELFFESWKAQPTWTFQQVAEYLIHSQSIIGSKKEALKDFLTLFEETNRTERPSILVNNFIQKTAYFTYLKTSFETDEATAKIENVKELLTAIKIREEQQPLTVSQFLEEVALLQEQLLQAHTDHDYVHVMTLHAAKGLEFDMVCITGLEENVLPSGHAAFQQERLEEERRLLYVGITRAREWLLMTHTRYRSVYGTLTEQRPSRFLKELPLEIIQYDDMTIIKPYEVPSYFSRWFKGSLIASSTNTSKVHVIPSTSSAKKDILPKHSRWYNGQQVTHAKFGTGIVEKVEQKIDKMYITVRFGSQVKKVAAEFLQ